MKIHHIGYLVSDMDKAIQSFREMGGVLETELPVFDPDRMIDIAFVRVGATLLELVCPREGCITVGEALKRLKNIPYHLCFECASLEDTINELVNKGCLVVEEPKEACAIHNQKVAFLYSSEMGLFELVEMRP